MGRFHVVLMLLIALAIMALFVMGAKIAHAQGDPACADSKAIFKGLSEKFGESPIGAGISEAGELVTIFISRSGTFTIVVSTPTGISCVRSSGKDWMTAPLPKGKES